MSIIIGLLALVCMVGSLWSVNGYFRLLQVSGRDCAKDLYTLIGVSRPQATLTAPHTL